VFLLPLITKSPQHVDYVKKKAKAMDEKTEKKRKANTQ